MKKIKFSSCITFAVLLIAQDAFAELSIEDLVSNDPLAPTTIIFKDEKDPANFITDIENQAKLFELSEEDTDLAVAITKAHFASPHLKVEIDSVWIVAVMKLFRCRYEKTDKQITFLEYFATNIEGHLNIANYVKKWYPSLEAYTDKYVPIDFEKMVEDRFNK